MTTFHYALVWTNRDSSSSSHVLQKAYNH